MVLGGLTLILFVMIGQKSKKMHLISEQLFYRTPLHDYFWKDNMKGEIQSHYRKYSLGAEI